MVLIPAVQRKVDSRDLNSMQLLTLGWIRFSATRCSQNALAAITCASLLFLASPHPMKLSPSMRSCRAGVGEMKCKTQQSCSLRSKSCLLHPHTCRTVVAIYFCHKTSVISLYIWPPPFRSHSRWVCVIWKTINAKFHNQIPGSRILSQVFTGQILVVITNWALVTAHCYMFYSYQAASRLLTCDSYPCRDPRSQRINTEGIGSYTPKVL